MCVFVCVGGGGLFCVVSFFSGCVLVGNFFAGSFGWVGPAKYAVFGMGDVAGVDIFLRRFAMFFSRCVVF